MARKRPWYDEDDDGKRVDPKIAAEAGKYAKAGLALVAKEKHEREHTCPHCKRLFGAIKLHLTSSACARNKKRRDAQKLRREERKANNEPPLNFYERELGEPVKGTLAWAIKTGKLRK